MLRGDGNRIRHESLGISLNIIRVKSRVGALEDAGFKRVKLEGILNFKITPIPNQNDHMRDDDLRKKAH